MFQQEIKELQEVNVEFNVTMAWFRKHIDKENETLADFLKLNSLFPVGEARDQAYIELAWAKTRDRGFENRLREETKVILAASKYALAVHIANLQKAAVHHKAFKELYEKVADTQSSNALQTILNNPIIIG